MARRTHGRVAVPVRKSLGKQTAMGNICVATRKKGKGWPGCAERWS